MLKSHFIFLYQIHGDNSLIDYRNNFAHRLMILGTGTNKDRYSIHPGFGVLLDVFDKKIGIRQRDSKNISNI